MGDAHTTAFFGVWGEAPYIMVHGWGAGRNPAYIIPARSEREAEPRIYTFSLGRGVGRRPTYTCSLCRGVGRGAPPTALPCGERSPANSIPLRGAAAQGDASYFFVFINPRRGKTLRHISEASAAFSTSGRIYGTTQYVRALTNPAAALPFEYTSANQTVPTA